MSDWRTEAEDNLACFIRAYRALEDAASVFYTFKAEQDIDYLDPEEYCYREHDLRTLEQALDVLTYYTGYEARKIGPSW